MQKGGSVYIMASPRRRLYTGVTSKLRLRVQQHKQKLHAASFSARYNINRLVFFEHFETINEAIARESTIKNMHRLQKVQLIVAINPDWRDLSEDWDKPATPFDETKLKTPTTF